MSGPKFAEIRPDYRKGVLKVTLRRGKKLKTYTLPFAVFAGMRSDRATVLFRSRSTKNCETKAPSSHWRTEQKVPFRPTVLGLEERITGGKKKEPRAAPPGNGEWAVPYRHNSRLYQVLTKGLNKSVDAVRIELSLGAARDLGDRFFVADRKSVG